jgi:hypothetical protein
LWGAQYEQRSSVTAYTPTTDQPITNYIPVLQSAASGEARFDNDPVTGESKGLLIEEQRTNVLTYSEQFDNAAWTKLDATITANDIIAPDGTLTMDKLVPATGAYSDIYRANATVGAKTLSCYMKAGGKTVGQLGWLGNANGAYFDLSSGVATTFGSGTTASMVSVGNGVYRCSISFTYASGNSNHFIGVSDAVGSLAVTGDGYSGIYIWGAQLEVGAFPTSYIPTVASQVTRNADAASMTGTNFSSWYRADEGTLFAETASPNSFSRVQISVNDGTNNNKIEPVLASGNAYLLGVNVGGSAVGSATTSNTTTANVSAKTAGAYKVNDFAVSLNAGTVATDTSGVLPVVDRMFIGQRTAGSVSLNGTIKKLAYYPARLSNTELQGLTS